MGERGCSGGASWGGGRCGTRSVYRAFALVAGWALLAACSVDDRTPDVSDGSAGSGAGAPGSQSVQLGNSPAGNSPAGNSPAGNSPGGAASGSPRPGSNEQQPANTPVAPGSSESQAPARPNLFTDLLGIAQADVDAKLTQATERFFGIGTTEPNTPTLAAGFRLYYALPQDPNVAFIWAPDSQDIRSEGLAYGMMIAVQMELQPQFDRLWNFARDYAQYPANSNVQSWRRYFRWRGVVDTTSSTNWVVTYEPALPPAADADEYIAAALYLADRRWGSADSVNYKQEADALSSALLINLAVDGRTGIFDAARNLPVFSPLGGTALYTNPSFHLPAFYELFAARGPAANSTRWREIAALSRQFLVASAHPVTGLHPDYADFDGKPNTGGSDHDQFHYDAWRVVLNMAVDVAEYSQDPALQGQIEKYYNFFRSRIGGGNVQNSLFALDGSGATGGPSAALTATLGAAALGSNAPDRAAYVQNLWNVAQPSQQYRHYNEIVYMLGLLAAGGRLDVGADPE